MIQQEEERFLAMGRRLGFLSEAQIGQARSLSLQSSRKKKTPMPFLLLEMGHLDTEQIDRILEELIRWVDATVERADQLRTDRQYTRAIKKYSKVLDAQPEREHAYWHRAHACVQIKHFEEALADYNRLLEISDKQALAFNRRGLVLFCLGRVDEAIDSQNQAIELNSKMAQAFFDRGTCFHRKKSFQNAIQDYTDAIELDDQYIEAFNNRAIAYLMCRQTENSRNDWNKAIEINNRRSTIRHNLTVLLKKLGGKGPAANPG